LAAHAQVPPAAAPPVGAAQLVVGVAAALHVTHLSAPSPTQVAQVG